MFGSLMIYEALLSLFQWWTFAIFAKKQTLQITLGIS
jgi:hypothetical protein